MAKTGGIHIELTGELAKGIAEKLEQVHKAYADYEREFIRVYRFHEAPEELRRLSDHGGDEDWLAIVPPEYEQRHYITWLESGTGFGPCEVSKHELIDGSRVYIGAHA